MTDDAPPRLYLITPVLTGAAGEEAALAAALGGGGEIACVLARFAARDERAAKALLRGPCRLAQEAGAAFLVPDDARLAAHLDADGVHVSGGPGDRLEAAIASVKPERIVGCGGLASRDDAMRAGEADLDYLLFGDAEGADPEAVAERVAWWAEIFNVPCVGVAGTLAAVGPLARTGAEFVALGGAVFDDPRGPAAAVAEALRTLRDAQAASGAAGA